MLRFGHDRRQQRTSRAERQRPILVSRLLQQSTARANRAAHLYYAEGTSFQEAMLGAGYSATVAKQGPKFILRHSVGLRAAFEQASKQHLRPEQLKTLAVHRLTQEIANPERPNGIRAIEVLGKMKEFDWFVRGPEVQVGVFAALAEWQSSEEDTRRLEAYEEMDNKPEDKQSE